MSLRCVLNEINLSDVSLICLLNEINLSDASSSFENGPQMLLICLLKKLSKHKVSEPGHACHLFQKLKVYRGVYIYIYILRKSETGSPYNSYLFVIFFQINMSLTGTFRRPGRCA